MIQKRSKKNRTYTRVQRLKKRRRKFLAIIFPIVLILLLVTGGVFKNFNPGENLSEGENTNYLGENFKVSALTTSSSVTYTVYEEIQE